MLMQVFEGSDLGGLLTGLSCFNAKGLMDLVSGRLWPLGTGFLVRLMLQLGMVVGELAGFSF